MPFTLCGFHLISVGANGADRAFKAAIPPVFGIALLIGGVGAVTGFIAVIVLGFIGYYLSSYLDFAGLAYITAGLERLILFLYPTMTVVLSAILFKRGITRRETLALTLSYAGIALVFMHDVATPSDHLLIGAGLVFASTLTYSAYLIGAGRVIARLGRPALGLLQLRENQFFMRRSL